MFSYFPLYESLVSHGISRSVAYQQEVFDLCTTDFGTDETPVDCNTGRTDDSQLPWETGSLYGGWGGHEFFETTAGATRAPVVFVHGNRRDADDWDDTCDRFLDEGYRGDELWAITFSERTATHGEMRQQLDDFIAHIRSYTGSDSVLIVAHSLGVTGVRYWLLESDRYEWVDAFVGLAGANHGMSWATLCCNYGFDIGPGQVSPFLRADHARQSDHPLTELNQNETPGDVDYYTIRGQYDRLFWADPASPRLDGAVENIVLPTGHDGVRETDAAVDHIFGWMNQQNSCHT